MASAEAPRRDVGRAIKRAHRSVDDAITTAGRWTLGILLLYAFAPGLTPSALLRGANDTAARAAHQLHTAWRTQG